MFSFIRGVAVIAGCQGSLQYVGSKKQKWILQGPLLADILVKYVFELRKTCPNHRARKIIREDFHS